jgi:Uma2 family endonuclease
MTAVLGTSTQDKILTDEWVKASWGEFQPLEHTPEYTKKRFYYDQFSVRIEMAALGPAHGRDNSVIARLIYLLCSRVFRL